MHCWTSWTQPRSSAWSAADLFILGREGPPLSQRQHHRPVPCPAAQVGVFLAVPAFPTLLRSRHPPTSHDLTQSKQFLASSPSVFNKMKSVLGRSEIDVTYGCRSRSEERRVGK